MSDDERTPDQDDLRGRGIRFDPVLPPMTPTSGPGPQSSTPRASIPSEESDQREAVRELDRAHGRDMTEES